MESVFTLPYPEFESAHILQSYFKKKDGFAVLFPTSRQQKGNKGRFFSIGFNDPKKGAFSILNLPTPYLLVSILLNSKAVDKLKVFLS